MLISDLLTMNNLISESTDTVLSYKIEPEQDRLLHGNAIIELTKEQYCQVDMGNGPITHIVNINTERTQIIYAGHKPELNDTMAGTLDALEQSCNLNFAQILNFGSTILLQQHVTKLFIADDADAYQRLPPDGGEAILIHSTLINASNNADVPDR